MGPLRATHEVAEQGQDPFRRLLGEEVPAVLELMHLGVRERRLPVLKLLPPERDVVQSPQDQRPLVRDVARFYRAAARVGPSVTRAT